MIYNDIKNMIATQTKKEQKIEFKKNSIKIQKINYLLIF